MHTHTTFIIRNMSSHIHILRPSKMMALIRRFKVTKPRSAETEQLLAARYQVALDEAVDKGLNNDQFKVSNHPGVSQSRHVVLPSDIEESVEKCFEKHPNTYEMASEALLKYIKTRKVPVEGEHLQQRISLIQEQAIKRGIIEEGEEMDEETATKHQKKNIKQLYSSVVYQWKPIEYNLLNSLSYLYCRAAPDFACLVKVFKELKKKKSDFVPKTLFDFGSGVGTVTWAVDAAWPKQCQETLSVDCSPDMIDIARSIISVGGDADDTEAEFRVRKNRTFFRQFTPASDSIKYDLVVSSRSLFELGDVKSRIKTVDMLWRKVLPGGILVLVEAGTYHGYSVLLEARDYLLEISAFERKKFNEEFPIHVVAPCAHDLFCPRFGHRSKRPCFFSASYMPLRGNAVQRDNFSYVILQKAPRSQEKEWPRVVEPVLCRNKHVIIRTCVPEAEIREFVVSSGKHSKNLYRVAKALNWGDRFPAFVIGTSTGNEEVDNLEDEKSKSSSPAET